MCPFFFNPYSLRLFIKLCIVHLIFIDLNYLNLRFSLPPFVLHNYIVLFFVLCKGSNSSKVCNSAFISNNYTHSAGSDAPVSIITCAHRRERLALRWSRSAPHSDILSKLLCIQCTQSGLRSGVLMS